MSNICFIGGGNMARAIIGGLLTREPTPGQPLSIRVAEPLKTARAELESRFQVKTFANSSGAIAGAETVVLAVKPQIIPLVLQQLKDKLQTDQLLISVAAGTSCQTIEAELGRKVAIIRAMPNLPAIVGAGITGVFANRQCKQKDLQQAKEILSAVGQVIWIDKENLMDAVTAVSGSGPAYVFYLIESMRDAGVSAGLDFDTATQLALHTVVGSGKLAQQENTDVSELRRQVTSPGGTTAAAVAVLDEAGCDAIFRQAIFSARDRARELSGISS
ncbi:MAG: pyrroline-5-carboxylate reductase [Xanthomonadales bacterium]|nr:pyrroline-5-carboxylate reductase [Xanthomonadales bacterium]